MGLPKKEDVLRKLTNDSKKPDNRMMLAKALDQVYLCSYDRIRGFTDFLDPVCVNKMLGVVHEFGLMATVFGGYDGAERAKIGLDETEISGADFPIRRVLIKYNQKFAPNLAHSDFLGAVIGLGLNRSKLGDIVLTMRGAVLLAETDAADYILANMSQVGKVGVKTAMIADDDEFFGLNNQHQIRLTLASLRLDNMLAAAFGISRKEAVESVSAGRVFVNWQGADSVSRAVCEGDIITLRKFGRIRIDEIGGKSRKDKIYVGITKY